MTTPGVEVDVQIAAPAEGVPGVAQLRRWAAAAVGARAAPAEVTVRIVDEVEGRMLNATYRGRDAATNVLSFPYEPAPGVTLPLLGDLVICAPVVAAEAHEQGKALEAHYAHLVVHGMLHLLGHDHQGAEEAAAMEAVEIRILQGLGYEDPYLSYEER